MPGGLRSSAAPYPAWPRRQLPPVWGTRGSHGSKKVRSMTKYIDILLVLLICTDITDIIIIIYKYIVEVIINILSCFQFFQSKPSMFGSQVSQFMGSSKMDKRCRVD